MKENHLQIRQDSSPEFLVPVSHDRVQEAREMGSSTFPVAGNANPLPRSHQVLFDHAPASGNPPLTVKETLIGGAAVFLAIGALGLAGGMDKKAEQQQIKDRAAAIEQSPYKNELQK